MQKKSQSSATNDKKCDQVETRFFAGDWNDMDHILPHVLRDECGGNCDEEPDRQPEGYDIILMAETVYSISSLPTLYKLIKKVTFIFLEKISFQISHKFLSHFWVFFPSHATVFESSTRSCIHGSKEALFWSWRRIKEVYLLSRKGLWVTSWLILLIKSSFLHCLHTGDKMIHTFTFPQTHSVVSGYYCY